MKRLINGLALYAIFFSVALATGASTYYTRNVQKHSEEYGLDNSNEHHVFNKLLAPSIGGVIAQAMAVGPNGETDFILSLPNATQYTGEISVAYGDTEGLFEVDYDLLVRVALFIDGARTALYTLWNKNSLPADFPRRAGFLPVTLELEKGMVLSKKEALDLRQLLMEQAKDMVLSDEDEAVLRRLAVLLRLPGRLEKGMAAIEFRTLGYARDLYHTDVSNSR